MKNKIKSIAVTAMAVWLMFATISCGSKNEVEEHNKGAFEKSREAYDNITEAYAVAENMASDIYEAWRQAITEGEDMTESGLSKKINLSLSDLQAGIDSYLGDINTDIGSVAELDGGFSYIVNMVIAAYTLNGQLDEAKNAINNAKALMKDMSAEYSDYEHYPALKGYFTSTNSLLTWCESPVGSFEQAKTTINDYRNEIRDHQQDLDYIFED